MDVIILTHIKTLNTSTLQGLYIYKPIYKKLFYITYILPPIGICFNLDNYKICNCYYKNICIDDDFDFLPNQIVYIDSNKKVYIISNCSDYSTPLVLPIDNICKSCCDCIPYTLCSATTYIAL